MKCEIIRDLLPLYIENLCSEESCREVEAHLASCGRCRAEYRNMTAEVPVAETDEERVQKILKEADLFINSKKEVERSFVDRALRVFNLIVFCLAAVCNVLAAAVVIFGYGLRYPSVYLDYKGFLQIFIILYALCPTVISLVNLCIMKRYPGRKKILTRVRSGVLVPAVLAGLIGTVSLFLIPPFCSATSRITAYMKVDKDVEDSVRAAAVCFPAAVPEAAEAAVYHYSKFSTLFEDSWEMEAGWNLPKQEFESEKKRISELRALSQKSETKSGTEYTVSGMVYPEGVSVTVIFDDAAGRIEYRAHFSGSK